MESYGYAGPFYEFDMPDKTDNTRIGKYFVETSLHPEPTNFSFIHYCYDTEYEEKKVIKFIKFYRYTVEKVRNKVELLRSVQHPNIIKIEDSFRHGPFMCIIIPYTPHRSIQTFISRKYTKNWIPEKLVSIFMYQMLLAVE